MNLTTIALRNLKRNRFRTVLTVLGVAVAVIAFIVLRTIVGAWTMAADYAAKDRLVTRNKITFIMPLPKRYMETMRSTPGVRESTFASWFGGKDPRHPNEFFATMAVDSPSFFKVYDDCLVPPDQLEAWQKDPQGVLVGDLLAKKLGYKPGDRVRLESGIYPEVPTWEFRISGVYAAKSPAVDRASFFFHWNYLDRALPADRQGMIGWITSRVNDPTQTAETSAVVDKGFEDQDLQTTTQDEHTFSASWMAGLSAVFTAMDVVSVVILLLLLLVLGNTIAMGVRERTSEYGAMKALGFDGRQLAFLIMGEAVFTALVGAGVGIGLAYPMINGALGPFLVENMGSFFPYVEIQPGTVVLALLAALGLGSLAGILPGMQASRLKVVDALRRIA